ncbi:CRISPR-associated helicase Cas3', partial [Rhodovulum sp. 12E13]
MIDVGAVAEKLAYDKPRRNALALCAALHDLGKFSASFRAMLRDGEPQSFSHWKISEYLLRENDDLLASVLGGEGKRSRRDLYAAIAGHHGRPPQTQNKDFPRMRLAVGDEASREARAAVVALIALWPDASPIAEACDRTALTWWLPGFIAAADWLGSSADFFPPCAPGPSFATYLETARARAEIALDEAGLRRPSVGRAALLPHSWKPRPMQQRAAEVALPRGPALALIEDETGAGKTEAALILAQRMLAEGKGDGIYIALPTMATANAMFARTSEILGKLYAGRPTLALAHGRARQSEAFRALIGAEARGEDSPTCTTWLADDRRRALLATVGVGTIDQALLSVLPTRHAPLRHFALSSKVLIVDEVHELGTPYILEGVGRLLEAHRANGGSAILMTATLPKAQRSRLFAAWQAPPPKTDAYPALSVAGGEEITDLPQETGPRGTVTVTRVESENAAFESISEAAAKGAAAVWIRNAVDDSINAFEALRERKIDVALLHARYALCDRLRIESEVLATFGKHRLDRPGKVLVATQVVESSLDLDFDLMISDLAPVPALIQRAGRLWRHMARRPAESRAFESPELQVLSPDPSVVDDKRWLADVLDRGAWVYPLDVQWRGAGALFAAGRIEAPSQLRALVEAAEHDGEVPAPLQDAELDRLGSEKAERTLAKQNLLDFTRPYRDATGFDSDGEFPTRLGREQRKLILARPDLSPWSGGDWDADSCQLSEVSADVRRLARLNLPDQLDPALASIRRKWPEWRQNTVTLCPVAEDGRICDGLFYDPALFIEIGGNGWRARESSVESSCYTKSDSSPRSTPWVKRYSR